MTLTHGSLFSGIGGIDLGLERAGWQTRWQVEKDDYARAVLQRHWPEIRRWSDIREFPGPETEWVDLISAGFPCQDLSIAGKGRGLRGSRSGLFWEALRVVRSLRPNFVLLENVPALRSRGLDAVLGALAQERYDAEWHCIPASALGAPHRRDRIFILAYTASQCWRPGFQQDGRPRLSEAGGGLESRDDGRPVSESVCTRLEGHGDQPLGVAAELASTVGDGWWASEPDVGRMAYGVPARVDRLKCLGNAVVPQVAQLLGELIRRRFEV